MYESFFELSGRPFAAAPCRQQYFPAAAIQHARQTLARTIARAEGPALAVGPAGTGKTLLCQILADDFASQLDCVQLASGNLATCRSLLQSVLYDLRLPYRGLDEGELRLALLERATRQLDARPILVLVDEAQLLPTRLLEELRQLTNLSRSGQPQVRLVLVGGAELEERFASPKLESFSQRLAARCYLEPFARDETCAYIASRVAACGPDVDRVFTAEAVQRIHQASEGIPRLINQLADHALLLAYAEETRPVDARLVAEAWSDLQQLPPPWSQSGFPAVSGETRAAEDTIEFGVLEEEAIGEAARLADAYADDDEPATVPWPHLAEAEHGTPEQLVPSSQRPQAPFQFPPAASIESVDDFDEEVVIDPYATLDARQGLTRHRVSSSEGRELWSQLAPFADAALRQSIRVIGQREAEDPSVEAPAAHPVTTARAAGRTAPPTQQPPAAVEDGDLAPPEKLDLTEARQEDFSLDDDLIIIEDEAEPIDWPQAPGFRRIRRQEYKQLFKKLRSG